MNFDFVIIQAHLNNKKPIKLLHRLQEKGYEVALLTGKIWSSSGFDKSTINSIYHYDLNNLYNKEDNRFSFTTEEIKRIKREYNIPTFRRLYFTELVYRKPPLKDYYELSNNFDERKYLKRSVFAFQFLENFLNEHDVNKFFSLNFGGTIFKRATYRVANQNNIPYIYGKGLPLENDLFTFISNEDDKIEHLELKKTNKLTKENVNKAKKYIERIRKENKMHFWKENSKPLTSYTKLIKNKYYRDREEGKSIFDTFLDLLAYANKNSIKPLKYNRLWKKPDFDEDFYFFPLHFHKESILAFRNPQFWRQEWIAEYIARMLPSGYKLYVKPHPSWKTDFPYSGLRMISEVSNIRIIDPEVNTHKLIKNSSAVVVISNTTGFESIIHRKPIISLGKSWYRGYGFTIDVDNFWKLDEALNKVLEFEIKEEDVVKFIASLFSISYQGKLDSIDQEEFITDENLEKVTEALIDFIDKMERLDLS